MPIAIDDAALALGIAAPQQKYQMLAALVQQLHRAIRELLPAVPLVRCGAGLSSESICTPAES